MNLSRLLVVIAPFITAPTVIASAQSLSEQQATRPTEAYNVEVKAFDRGKFLLKDGSIFELRKHDYVNRIGYREKGLLFVGKGNEWFLCLDNGHYQVRPIRQFKHHHSREIIVGKSYSELEQYPICQTKKSLQDQKRNTE
ncbi:hypothetical protein [Photobacterium makurazakiensis]|uniref:hypothetical protein n=1 Tax=Photobacterium makurazakiensis TaxID=2910234 RepID=UPI003D0D7E6C